MRSGAPGHKNRLREVAWLALLAVPGLVVIAFVLLPRPGEDRLGEHAVTLQHVLLVLCITCAVIAWRAPGPRALRWGVVAINLALPCLLVIAAYAFVIWSLFGERC